MQQLTLRQRFLLEKAGFKVFFFFSKTECIGRDTNQLQLNVANAVIAKCRSDVGAQLCFVGTRWDTEFKIGLYQRNDMSDEEV